MYIPNILTLAYSLVVINFSNAFLPATRTRRIGFIKKPSQHDIHILRLLTPITKSASIRIQRNKNIPIDQLALNANANQAPAADNN